MRSLRTCFQFSTILSIICVIFYFKSVNKHDNHICGRYPSRRSLAIDQTIWQHFIMPQGVVKLLNAYLDTRLNQSVVRVNVNGIRLDVKNHTIYCQFWIEGADSPVITYATDFVPIHRASTGWTKHNNPYLITCPLPVHLDRLPKEVSLTTEPCEFARNLLRIIDEQPVDGVKKSFGVCSKILLFEDREFAFKFIEWVHMLRILGAEKIYFYGAEFHPDMEIVFDYFKKKNFIEKWQFFSPSDFHYTTKRGSSKSFVERNFLTDCFHRIRNFYEYVVILDPDEVIMPVSETDKNWFDLFEHFKALPKRDSYSSTNIYYPNLNAEPFADIPAHFYLLQHVQRSQNFSHESYPKSFISTERVFTVWQHYAFHCIDVDPCNNWRIPTSLSQTNHYRIAVPDARDNVTIIDKIIWRYKDALIKAVRDTLDSINFK